ncbi:partial penicillin-binding protein 1C, partial [Myxococcaceae bacterium]
MTRHRARSIAAAILLVALAIGFAFATRPPSLPTFSEVRSGFVASDLRLFDRRGELLHERRVGADSRSLAWVPLEVVSPALIGAVIASEDRRFREHGGIDVLAMAAAARDRLLRGSRRGASTISMQLAALVGSGLSRRDSSDLLRKLRQIRAARAIESSWSKDEILEAYLNLASFRGELRGVGAAARGLFERSPAALGGAEAAVLAALLRAPNAPVERVAARAAALAASTDLAAADEAASRARRALSTPPGLAPAVAIAPHLATRLLAPGGGDVRTTIDANVQRLAIRALREQIVSLADRNVRDGAVLVVENETGEVLAWVGSSADLSPAPLVDGVRARRQAGSTLKPFLYALAFEARLLTPASLLDDSPLEIATAAGIYRPENYDRSFRGLVPARVALASSLNVPAVRVAGLVGVGRFVERLAALGFDELRRPDYYGESLSL